jgi:RNA polymerase sigma factor (sigma-70 family)
MAALTQTDQSDRQLVERALAGQDETAFQTIVYRHGSMVYRVCWRVLQHQQDAEDAFQATFLVLAQKLRSLRKHASLASWLHGVAHRVALRAKAQAAAQRRREGQASLPDCLPPDDATWGELRTALDFQLSRLPDKWRLPLILCYLEGRTQDEAAGQLGWSKSTLRRRLEEARAVLGSRLKGCGFTAPTALAAVLLTDCIASAAPVFGLVASTVEAATGVAAGKAVVAVATAQVAAHTEGVLKAMFLYKLKMVTALLLALLSVGILGGGLYTQAGAEQGPTHAKPAVKAEGVARQPELADRSVTTQDAEKPVPTKDDLRGKEVKAAVLKSAGDDEPARALLAEVLKDAHRAKVLDEAVQHPERSGKLYAAEQWRLWQKAVSTPPGAKEADIPTAPEIALSFFLGSHPSSADALKTEPPPNDSRITETYRAIESDLLCKSLQLELMDPKRRGPFARLMAGWMATRADP